jgi:hypothetical protein
LLFCHFRRTGTDHLEEGGKKDSVFVASLFDPWVKKLDPMSTRVDCVFFDGASNVQKAGDLLAAKYPRIHVQTCAAHAVALFFSDICQKLWQIRLMLVNYRRLYRLFGSGSMHSPYALFCKQSMNFNGGRKVGLIRAAGTRMAGHAYAQCRMLRLRAALVATITSAAYLDLKLKGFPKKVEEYINDADMWEATYVVQRCLYPMIRVLRLCDTAACGGMSKIVYYVHKTDAAIANSMESLRDLNYFRNHEAADADDEEGIDLKDDFDDDDGSDEELVTPAAGVVEDDEEEIGSDSDSDDDEQLHLGEQILLFWQKRREKLITPLSLAGWFCSPHADIRADVAAFASGADRLEVEKAIAKIFFPMEEEELGRTIQVFWREFDDFQTKKGPSYGRAHIWSSAEVQQGNDHLWHKIYSLAFTTVFGIVACRVCSKPLGCGQAERNWGALKHLKGGKRSHLSAEKAERQATIFGASCIERSRSIHAAEERNGMVVDSRWTDADFEFDLGLETWAGAPGDDVPVPEVPKRIFRAWIEDWEWECMKHKDPVSEAKLVQKYQGLRFVDPDLDRRVGVLDEYLIESNLEYQGGKGGSGWCLIGTRERDGGMEPWDIHMTMDLIADFEQPAELNVEVIVNNEERNANYERIEEEKSKKQPARPAKRKTNKK